MKWLFLHTTMPEPKQSPIAIAEALFRSIQGGSLTQGLPACQAQEAADDRGQ
jgi:hypothetical protein